MADKPKEQILKPKGIEKDTKFGLEGNEEKWPTHYIPKPKKED